MSLVTMTIRMDSELKKSFDSLCLQYGISANDAMNQFAKAVVQRGGIPFELVSDKVTASESAQMVIDKYFDDNQMGISDIEAMLSEHMRTPYTQQ